MACAKFSDKCVAEIAAARKLITKAQQMMNKTAIACDVNNKDRTTCSADLAKSLKFVNGAGMDITIASEGTCNALSQLFLH